MVFTVDARGLECPEPAIRTGQALKDQDEILVIVDDKESVENIKGAVEKRGYQVHAKEKGNDYYLTITRGTGGGAHDVTDIGNANTMPIGDTVIFLPSDKIGEGNDELGGVLTKAIIYSLTQVEPKPDTMILMNGGVTLAVDGSDVLDDLTKLVEGGMGLLVCGTCLDYYEIKDKLAVGSVSNAYTIIETMLEAGKVIRL
jgi:selenium metabolism protein YedF